MTMMNAILISVIIIGIFFGGITAILCLYACCRWIQMTIDNKTTTTDDNSNILQGEVEPLMTEVTMIDVAIIPSDDDDDDAIELSDNESSVQPLMVVFDRYNFYWSIIPFPSLFGSKSLKIIVSTH